MEFDMSEPTCAVDNCDKVAWSRGWCGTHYARWRRLGTTELPVTPQRTCELTGCDEKHYGRGMCRRHYQEQYTPPTIPLHGRVCVVDECDRVSEKLGLCGKHYQRLKRTGSTDEPVRATECAVSDCNEVPHSRGWCQLHYNRWYHTGTTASPDAAPLSAEYSAVHHRLRSHYGPASACKCVECGEVAHQWAYDHCDPNEVGDPKGRTRAYSVDLSHYQPMCRSCHISLDYWHSRGVVTV